jgi:hypothetical protein
MQLSTTQQNPDDVQMTDGSGAVRWVPPEDVAEALAAGATMVAETTAEAPHWSERVWDTMRAAPGVAADVAIGAGKAGARSILGAGQWARENVPGVQALHDVAGGDWATVDMATLEPTNRAQELGGVGERVGEFFIPVGGVVGGVARRAPGLMRHIPRLQRGVESAGAGGLTLAHGGSVPEALTAAALQGVIPSAPRAAGVAREGAERSMARSLRPTTTEAKTRAAELAPEMLERGVGGTQAGMLREAQREVGRIGPQIGAEVTSRAQRGVTVKTSEFLKDMRAARLRSQGASEGISGAIPGTGPILKRLDELEAFALKQGDEIPIDHAQAIKRTWDDIVSKSGLYGRHADAAPTDRAAAWVYREGASAMRRLISLESPTLAKLNTEFGFWKGLEDVLSATALRTQGQGAAMTQTLTGGFGGAIVGVSTGSTLQGFMGMAAMSALTRTLQSSHFRSRVAGPLKAKLADALSAGDQGLVLKALANIAASVPSIRDELVGSLPGNQASSRVAYTPDTTPGASLAFTPNSGLTRRY